MGKGRELTIRMEDVPGEIPHGSFTMRLLLSPERDGHYVYTIETPPGYTIEPHYHDVDQFQIIIAGSGTIAGEPVSQGSVHYTDAMVPYGPIVSGPEGLTFMVVRPNVDTRGKVRWIPDVIAEVKRVQAKKLARATGH